MLSTSSKLPQDVAAICEQALTLIQKTPLFEETAGRLEMFPLRFVPKLSDRAQLSFNRILIGPESVGSGPLSLAGTLVHEEWHTRQNPFLKTASFWRGIATGTHPMRLFEWPAYRRQIAFLRAVEREGLDPTAGPEADRVLESFRAHYGDPPDEPRWGRP